MNRVLIVDDDIAVCTSLKLLLVRKGYEVESIHTPSLLERKLVVFQPQLVILDMNFSIDTSGKQGLRALEIIKNIDPSVAIILITGWATVQLAVEGMKMGAGDFLAKPWDNDALMRSIETILAIKAKQASHAEDPDGFMRTFIGSSPGIVQIIDQALKIAATDASVLITGESGTGKELLAEMIHQHSTRSGEAFVKVNLGGIATSLFESEMFGHRKGAFTDAHSDRVGRFEKAHKGTIFLDEIAELDASSQVKLLRILQEKTFEKLGSSSSQKVDFRVISATNRDMRAMIDQKLFREDLFYRINLIQLHLPPLRDRREDIPLLLDHFVDKVCRNYDINKPEITALAMEWLTHQEYPGNIRQLSNIVERTILMNIGNFKITEQDFKDQLNQSSLGTILVGLPDVGRMSLDELEKQMILKTLAYHNNSISQSARSLGITRSSLYRRLDKYNISYESHS